MIKNAQVSDTIWEMRIGEMNAAPGG